MADELDRVLKDSFGRGKKGKDRKGLGSFDSANANVQGQSPAIVGRTAIGQMGRVLDELNRPGVKCPEWMNEDCLRVMSRFLEETFRNFQLNARPPSHIEPPFQARVIDAFPTAFFVAPAAFTTIPGVTFQVPAHRYRGEIWYLGQSADLLASWSDLAWRILVNEIPYDPYVDVRFQISTFVPLGKLCAPIHLRAGDTIELQVRSISGAPHSVIGRLGGWYYPIRTASGDEAKSTFVD